MTTSQLADNSEMSLYSGVLNGGDRFETRINGFRVSKRKNFLQLFRGVSKSGVENRLGIMLAILELFPRNPPRDSTHRSVAKHGSRGRAGEFKRDWPNGSSQIRHFSQP